MGHEELIREMEEEMRNERLFNYLRDQNLSELPRSEQPPQYSNLAIDTFDRCKANMTKEEITAVCKFNIDKYNWREKGSDRDDLTKIVAYVNLWLWAIENSEEEEA